MRVHGVTIGRQSWKGRGRNLEVPRTTLVKLRTNGTTSEKDGRHRDE